MPPRENGGLSNFSHLDIDEHSSSTRSASSTLSSSHRSSLDYALEADEEDTNESEEAKLKRQQPSENLRQVQNFLQCLERVVKIPAAINVVPIATSTITLAATGQPKATTTLAAIGELKAITTSNFNTVNLPTTISPPNSFSPLRNWRNKLKDIYISSITEVDHAIVTQTTTVTAASNSHWRLSQLTSLNTCALSALPITITTNTGNTRLTPAINTIPIVTPSISIIPTNPPANAHANAATKPTKFTISTKFLRKPRSKLRAANLAGAVEVNSAMPVTAAVNELLFRQLEQQQQFDSNAKFKDFSIDSLLNK